MRGILYAAEDEIRPEDVGIRHRENNDNCLLEDTFQNLAYREAKEQVLQRFHQRYIGNVLSATQGNVSRAARLCGLERQGLQQLMRRYAINAETYRSAG